MRKAMYEIQEGERLPRGYGVAYYDVARYQAICYPIPFNLLIKALREIYYRVASPSISEREKQVARAYQKGLLRGWKLHQERLEQELEKWIQERDSGR